METGSAILLCYGRGRRGPQYGIAAIGLGPAGAEGSAGVDLGLAPICCGRVSGGWLSGTSRSGVCGHTSGAGGDLGGVNGEVGLLGSRKRERGERNSEDLGPQHGETCDCARESARRGFCGDGLGQMRRAIEQWLMEELRADREGIEKRRITQDNIVYGEVDLGPVCCWGGERNEEVGVGGDEGRCGKYV